MNIQTLLGVFILVAIDNLNGRFLLVNVGDPAIDDDNRHRIGDPDVGDDNVDSRLGKIAVGKNLKIKEASMQQYLYYEKLFCFIFLMNLNLIFSSTLK